MRILPVLAVAGAFGVLWSPQALAWGDLGHEVVCQIAFQELTPQARSAVRALIANDPEFKTFAKSCTWPDDPPRQRPPEHYVNLDRAAAAFGDHACPEADRCVVSAILNDTRDLVLIDDESEQLRLLKSLGHWVGDVHQPMHVSFEDDRGANSVNVGEPCGGNLHAVWDSCVIERAGRQRPICGN